MSIDEIDLKIDSCQSKPTLLRTVDDTTLVDPVEISGRAGIGNTYDNKKINSHLDNLFLLNDQNPTFHQQVKVRVMKDFDECQFAKELTGDDTSTQTLEPILIFYGDTEFQMNFFYQEGQCSTKCVDKY